MDDLLDFLRCRDLMLHLVGFVHRVTASLTWCWGVMNQAVPAEVEVSPGSGATSTVDDSASRRLKTPESGEHHDDQGI
jgi:hypothetical protein